MTVNKRLIGCMDILLKNKRLFLLENFHLNRSLSLCFTLILTCMRPPEKNIGNIVQKLYRPPLKENGMKIMCGRY